MMTGISDGSLRAVRPGGARMDRFIGGSGLGGRHGWGEIGNPLEQGSERGELVLAHEGESAGVAGGVAEVLAVKLRNHHHPGFREPSKDGARREEPVDAGHLDVHQDDIRLVGQVRGQRVRAGGAFEHLGGGSWQEVAQRLSEAGMVVDQQNPPRRDRWCLGIRHAAEYPARERSREWRDPPDRPEQIRPGP